MDTISIHTYQVVLEHMCEVCNARLRMDEDDRTVKMTAYARYPIEVGKRIFHLCICRECSTRWTFSQEGEVIRRPEHYYNSKA